MYEKVVKLSELQPGDFPERVSWEKVSVKSFPEVHSPYPLDMIGISFLRVADEVLGECIFIPDGNHKIARLYNIGIREVKAYINSERMDGSDVRAWQIRIRAVREMGIRNVGDFLSKCREF